MPFTIDKVPDVPAIVFVHRAHDPLLDMSAVIARLRKVIDAQTEPVFVISDLGGAPMSQDMINFVNLIAHGDEAILRHGMVRENLLVTDASMVHLAAKGLISTTSGWGKGAIFASTREALDYCRGVTASRTARDVRIISR